jgi:hypothetical protein
MKQNDIIQDEWCSVGYRGNILCIPEVTTQVYCKQNLIQWPFDKFSCKLDFESYSKSNKIDFKNPDNVSDFYFYIIICKNEFSFKIQFR